MPSVLSRSAAASYLKPNASGQVECNFAPLIGQSFSLSVGYSSRPSRLKFSKTLPHSGDPCRSPRANAPFQAVYAGNEADVLASRKAIGHALVIGYLRHRVDEL